MRVEITGKSSNFSDLLMNVGDGNVANFPENFDNIAWVKSRAILCPTNEECRYINRLLLDQLPGDITVYRSCDTVSESEAHIYPTEFLNTIDLQGIPPHYLELKVGAVIMLLRNLNPSEGHVNGTRYVVQNLLPHVIDATSISGSKIGVKIFIPRIWLSNKDPTLPFEMKRKQFPVKLSYSMTANKAQGQTLSKVGIYIARENFSHGQLYVAISRVGDGSCVRILFKKKNKFHVKNVVFKEIL